MEAVTPPIKKDIMGFLYSILSSAAFGLIPLFTLPLMSNGVPPSAALFYRFAIATVVLGLVLAARGERFRARGIDLCKLSGMSLMYTLAALLFFWGFQYMPSSVAATLQFTYPVMVMLIMIVFYHERFSWITATAVLLAIAGVYLLSGGGSHEACSVSLFSLVVMLLSALCNAVYITGIYAARIPNMSSLVMTFYVLAFSTVISGGNALITGTFRPLQSWWELLLATLLAVVTAVVSNLTLILAVQRIGSTLTSIMGVMEPLTAVTVGILVFSEPFSLSLAAGVALIALSVVLVMLGKRITAFLRPRHA